jgi:hypothetical protein
MGGIYNPPTGGGAVTDPLIFTSGAKTSTMSGANGFSQTDSGSNLSASLDTSGFNYSLAIGEGGGSLKVKTDGVSAPYIQAHGDDSNLDVFVKTTGIEMTNNAAQPVASSFTVSMIDFRDQATGKHSILNDDGLSFDTPGNTTTYYNTGFSIQNAGAIGASVDDLGFFAFNIVSGEAGSLDSTQLHLTSGVVADTVVTPGEIVLINGAGDQLTLAPGSSIIFQDHSGGPSATLSASGGLVFSAGGSVPPTGPIAAPPGTALTITKTGSFYCDPAFSVIPAESVQSGSNALQMANGVWVNQFSYSEAGQLALAPKITSLAFPNLYGSQGTFTIESVSTLATLDASLMVYANSVSISGVSVLTTINMAALYACGPSNGVNGFVVNTAPLLTTLTLTALTVVNGKLTLATLNALATIAMANLQYVNGDFNLQTVPLLTTLTLTNLKNVNGSLQSSTMSVLTSISLPALQNVTGLIFFGTSSPLLTSVSMPSLVRAGSTITMNSGTAALTSFTLGTIGTLKQLAGNVVLSSCALTAASVNAILAVVASLDGTNGTTAFGAGRILTLTGTSAAPTGQGLIDKAAIQARGATVNTN